MRLHGHSVTGKTNPDAQAAPTGPLLRTRARPLSLIATAAFALLVLSACPPPESAPPPENEPQNGNTQPPKAGTPPEVANPTQELISSAARNAPSAGSVTQGSRGAGATLDRVRWTGDGVQIEGRAPLTRNVTGEIDPESGLIYFTDSPQNAVAAVVSSISSAPGGAPTPRFDADDPVVFGPWMYRISGDEFVWGMFADGLAAREASGSPGTYRGTTIGVYTDSEGVVDFFTARVMLVLAADGSLSGSISEVADRNGPVELPGGPPTVTLNRVQRAELLSGETAFGIGGTPQPGVGGKWGAAFFEGGEAAGTWGATDGTRFSVVGAFRATRQ